VRRGDIFLWVLVKKGRVRANRGSQRERARGEKKKYKKGPLYPLEVGFWGAEGKSGRKNGVVRRVRKKSRGGGGEKKNTSYHPADPFVKTKEGEEITNVPTFAQT